MIGLSERVHTFAHPQTRDELIAFFTQVVGCELLQGAVADPAGHAHRAEATVLAFRFANGTALSVEFPEDALDEQLARRGAWLELVTDDPVALTQKVVAAGLPRVDRPGSDVFSFQAPGGQVWRIVSTTGHVVTTAETCGRAA